MISDLLRRHKIVLGVVAAVVLSSGYYYTAQAFMGRSYGCGYFHNKCVSSSGNSDVLKGGIKNSIDTADELIAFLKGASGTQNKVGAAFVVNTMLGRDAPGDGTSVSSSDWADLSARLKSLDAKGGIKWNQTINNCTTNSYYQSTAKDDAFYKRTSKDSGGCHTDAAIKFYDGSKVVYTLDRTCANPIGSAIKELPKAPQWNVSVDSSVSVASATPGNTITWTHTVKNKGPDSTDQTVKYHYHNSGGLGSGTDSDKTLSSGASNGKTQSYTSTYAITQNDVGNNLCRSTVAKPAAWDDSGSIESSAACVFVPYNYNLTPFISANVSGAVEANTTFSVSPTITNTGPTKSNNTQWQITQIIVLPSKAVPNAAGGNSPIAPCGTYFKALPNASCSTVSSGTSVFSETGAWQSGAVVGPTSVTSGDYEVGTKICYAFSVQPRSSGDNQWAHSTPVCMVIGKKPKVQIWGGDLATGGLVQTSTSVKDMGGQRTFGSWAEYGIVAAGTISGMASGSAFANPGLLNATVCDYSSLSFTNAGNSTCPGASIGNYVSSRAIPNVAASFPVNNTDLGRNLGVNPLIDLSKNNLSGVYTASGAISITGGGAGKVINKGQWIVINAPMADVTITGDINYTGATLNSINDIPQVVITAKNINIPNNVTRVDAWLVADGGINTCSTVTLAAALTSSICDQLLTVNGPVMAQKLYLRRTAGSGTGAASGDPAEIFNLRPDAYLWSYARAISNGHIQTVHTTELPPRF